MLSVRYVQALPPHLDGFAGPVKVVLEKKLARPAEGSLWQQNATNRATPEEVKSSARAHSCVRRERERGGG
ncbi:hypothetical protein NDU88_001691 [Pleurodeles waltl]|uniref:Uncharacterized protein n=1 Tax=Pleurodeles waltl TaxID=8319 RepID=A0AAV7UWT4_PLEWA|nr:hypothetical protein NDU88_001691 [Pleurodeles waltl]